MVATTEPAPAAPTPHDLTIDCVGPCERRSPLLGAEDDAAMPTPVFVEDDERILFDDRIRCLGGDGAADPPAFELAGPRRAICFDPATTRIGIATCGGLCPGLNDVIRGLVMEAWHRYGVRRIDGFRYGFQGFLPELGHPVVPLEPRTVAEIHLDGGTILGSSRGEQDLSRVVDTLVERGINVLFLIGGDGTLRGALALADEIARRGLRIAVLGIPKTIDNDILFLDRSFGFETAYSAAVDAVYGAHNEARGAPNGVGLVKLMGRHSGFIACHATLATSHVNFCLIPEVPFRLDGERGFLASLEERLRRRRHAVVVVAEGAGQDLLAAEPPATDASGNRRLGDIGSFLVARIGEYARRRDLELNLKYIDPSYIIRSVPARPPDSVYCWRLAQNAVHAAMCGKTRMIVGQWHGRLVHIPMREAIRGRRQVDPAGEIWWSVLESTGQPPVLG